MAHWVQELKKAMTEKTAFVAGVETSTELAPTASSAFLINLHHGRAAIPNAPAPPRGVRVIDSI